MSKSIFCHARVSDSAGAIVTAVDATRTIDAASVVNTTGAPVALTVWQVPSAGARGDDNIIISALSIGAGATVTLAPLVNHAIARNATIHALAGAASSLTLMISGRTQ